MSVFRPLYDWSLRQAEKPSAKFVLFLVALFEPCLIPIPPDTLLIPMILARRDKALPFAAICTVGSVLGGIAGYEIGALAMQFFGQWVLAHNHHLQTSFQEFSDVFQRWGMLIIFIKAFIPVVPFMIVSVVSGSTHFNLWQFIFAASVTRGGRFFLEAWLIRRYGQPVQDFIERYMTWIGLGLLVCLIGVGWVFLRG